MTSALVSNDNPFKDPSLRQQSPNPAPPEDATILPVGKNAALTLGTDSLVVLGGSSTLGVPVQTQHTKALEDEEVADGASERCCGLPFGGMPKTTRSIPYYNILWAEISGDEITIRYAANVGKEIVRPAYLNFGVEKTEVAEGWIKNLLARAYGAAQPRKRVKVLVNPFGGKGNAAKYFTRDIEPILAAARCELDVEYTKYNGHGVEIAEKIDVNAWDVIACCSGDGVPHEVFNGLAKKHDAALALHKIAVVQLPCGSGNAMSLNLNGTMSPSLASLAIIKGLRTPLDLVSITQGGRRTISFLSQAIGIIAECDLGTENLRWMGSARFTYGILSRLVGKACWPIDLAVQVELEGKESIREAFRREAAKSPPTHDDRPLPDSGTGLPALKYGTSTDPLPPGWEMVPYDNMGNFYVGTMTRMSVEANFFPAALPNDGCMDMVTVNADIPRMQSLKMMVHAEKGTHFDMDVIEYRKVTAYRVIPKQKGEGYISIDGESVPFEPFQAEVHRGLGTVLSKTGHLFEAHTV